MAAAAIVGPLFLVPIPFLIFGPGDAVDLNHIVRVPNHSPPAGTLYLTDVRLFPGRPAYYVIARALPGFEIVPRAAVAPPNENDADLNRRLVDAMRESQLNAQVVAERAAGYDVQARYSFVVERRLAHTPGARCFELGDAIVAIDGQKPQHPDDLVRITRSRPAGTLFALAVIRGKDSLEVRCRTAVVQGMPRFGIAIEPRTESYKLPIHVAFSVPNINGSSAGLMFALQIYRTLSGTVLAGGKKVAGTGVLGFDGSVSAIEGAQEKLRAAQQAGAAVFLVPQANYADIRRASGVKIVPVSTFDGALKAMRQI